MTKNILVTRSSMPPLEEYIDEIRDMWNSHWLTNMGPKHKELQEKLEEMCIRDRCDRMPFWKQDADYYCT